MCRQLSQIASCVNRWNRLFLVEPAVTESGAVSAPVNGNLVAAHDVLPSLIQRQFRLKVVGILKPVANFRPMGLRQVAVFEEDKCYQGCDGSVDQRADYYPARIF